MIEVRSHEKFSSTGNEESSQYVKYEDDHDSEKKFDRL